MSLDDSLSTRISSEEVTNARVNNECLQSYENGIADMIGPLVNAIGEDALAINRLPPEFQFIERSRPELKERLSRILIQRASSALSGTQDGTAPEGCPYLIAAIILSPQSVSRELRILYVTKMIKWHQKHQIGIDESANNFYIRNGIITETEGKVLFASLRLKQVVELP